MLSWHLLMFDPLVFSMSAKSYSERVYLYWTAAALPPAVPGDALLYPRWKPATASNWVLPSLNFEVHLPEKSYAPRSTLSSDVFGSRTTLMVPSEFSGSAESFSG